MPTATLFPVANTVAGTPRVSASVTYQGTSDRTVLLQFVCPTWATEDPTQFVTISAEQSFDNGATWAQFCGTTARVTSVSRVGGHLPSVTCQDVDTRGPRLVRAVLSVDKGSLSVGVDATI